MTYIKNCRRLSIGEEDTSAHGGVVHLTNSPTFCVDPIGASPKQSDLLLMLKRNLRNRRDHKFRSWVSIRLHFYRLDLSEATCTGCDLQPISRLDGS